LVCELKLIENFELLRSLELRFFSGGKGILAHIVVGEAGANLGINGDSG